MDTTTLFSGTSIGSFILGATVGSIGTLFGIRITNSKKISASGSGNAVDQSHASAGGDIVGRDKRS
jgi:hypothetical protein